MRIASVEIPSEKRLEISLQYIYGIGKTTAKQIMKKFNFHESLRTKNLDNHQVLELSIYIEENFKIENALRKETIFNIQHMIDIHSYRGIRHKIGLPVRGARTHTNAKTHKKCRNNNFSFYKNSDIK